MIVGVNCGHTVSGTTGSGAAGILNESNETREVGRKLMEYLKSRGVTVVDCTNDYASSVNENLRNIVSMADKRPLDLFVSIHFNSGGGKGCEVYTYNAQKYDEAVRVCGNMAKLGFVNRGVKDGSNLYVVRRTKAKAMLVEVCFVDSKSDADLYRKVGADKVARAIGDAIIGENKEEETKMIYNYVDKNMPEWAREAVQWCVDNGIVTGTGSGLNLDDMKLWTCVVMYRLWKKLK